MNGASLRPAYHCAAEVLRYRRLAGQPIPAWLRDHFRSLEVEILAMSAGGHENQTDSASLEHDDAIGAEQAAAILGCSTRHIRRIAADLSGEHVSGAWVFKMGAVTEYANGRRTA